MPSREKPVSRPAPPHSPMRGCAAGNTRPHRCQPDSAGDDDLARIFEEDVQRVDQAVISLKPIHVEPADFGVATGVSRHRALASHANVKDGLA